MRSSVGLLGLLLAISALLPQRSHAQRWLDTRVHPPGRGVRVADLELHAGVGAAAGWSSDVFLADDPQPSAMLRITPHLDLATTGSDPARPGQRKLDFFAGLDAAFKHYFATAADTDLALGQDMRLSLRPGSIVGLDVFEEFERSIDPFTDPLPPPQGAQDVGYARDHVGLGTRLQVSSRGDVLKAGAGYRLDLDHFEDDAFREDRNRSHTFGVDLSWEFYPRTALFWNSSVRFFEYSNVSAAPRASRLDVTFVDSRVGLQGAVTPRVGLTAALGYGAAFVVSDHDRDTWLGQLEVRWRARDDLSWLLGAERGLGPAFQGDFASFNRIKTRLDATLGVACTLAFTADAAFVDYGRDVEMVRAGADPERNDIVLRTRLSGEYRILEWLALTGEAGYIQNFSDFVFAVPGGPGDEAAYQQFQLWLGARSFL